MSEVERGLGVVSYLGGTAWSLLAAAETIAGDASPWVLLGCAAITVSGVNPPVIGEVPKPIAAMDAP